MCDKNDLITYFCGLDLKKHITLSNHNKNIRQTPMKGYSTKYLPSTIQTVKVIKSKGISEKLPQSKDPKNT